MTASLSWTVHPPGMSGPWWFAARMPVFAALIWWQVDRMLILRRRYRLESEAWEEECRRHAEAMRHIDQRYMVMMSQIGYGEKFAQRVEKGPN